VALSDHDLVYAAIAKSGRGGGARPRGMLRLALRCKRVDTTRPGGYEHLLLMYSRFPFVLSNKDHSTAGLPARVTFIVSGCLTLRSGFTQSYAHVWRMLRLPSYRGKFDAVT